ncbi:metallophosphoesterase [Pedobacter sp. Leaf194]|uniref:metallophosphoesterase n=1 Tax=Pedobacter sp. Leaf194 TaxID=1736297 RepID=UPI000702E83E|nr:metallophosphoesterase [Pedobacter sp. Leaf194]KQS32415.1 metallophosphoesterase [Pedobacter sp. Leaf194]
MRKLLQKLLTGWIVRMSNRFGSRPDNQRIQEALSKLYENIYSNPGKRGEIFEVKAGDRFIILSDQHKGARDFADDFALAEKNYLGALQFYESEKFHYINLGDSEELWENLMETIIRHNKQTFEAEKLFINRNAFTKIFGNHDLYWDNDPLSQLNLKRIYGEVIRIYEGAILRFDFDGTVLDVFLTHGHQGDLQSDGNWFSKWFVSTIWAPLQSYLRINLNTPAYNNQLKTVHNTLMYNWVQAQKNIALITGHTHQPVFASLTHLERLYVKLTKATAAHDAIAVEAVNKELTGLEAKGEDSTISNKYRSGYFNSGCCCFNDGDITGIEIESGQIRLIKWSYQKSGHPQRYVLEEMSLKNLLE